MEALIQDERGHLSIAQLLETRAGETYALCDGRYLLPRAFQVINENPETIREQRALENILKEGNL